MEVITWRHRNCCYCFRGRNWLFKDRIFHHCFAASFRHYTCKMKLLLVTGAIWHSTQHRIFYVQRALLQLHRCQSYEKPVLIQQLLCLHFDKMFYDIRGYCLSLEPALFSVQWWQTWHGMKVRPFFLFWLYTVLACLAHCVSSRLCTEMGIRVLNSLERLIFPVLQIGQEVITSQATLRKIINDLLQAVVRICGKDRRGFVSQISAALLHCSSVHSFFTQWMKLSVDLLLSP